MRVKILDVAIENVVKGKSRYSKASVAYSYNGEARTQNIMDFANPAVFKQVKELVGQEVEVTMTKNAAGYNEWASIGEAGTSSAAPTQAVPTSTPARVTGSNFETPSERAQKQVYIVKQSSISNALNFHKDSNIQDYSVEDVLKTAQQFVDYVFDTQPGIEGLKSDLE